MRTRITLAGAATAVVAAMLVAGCGGDDGTTTSADEGGGQATAQGGTQTAAGGAHAGKPVTISETEYKLTPSDPTVKAGKVSFDAVNGGGVTHALEVEGPNGEVQSKDLSPGDSETITVDLSKPGTYEMYCPIANHRELGMQGEVVVN
ncbi:MAG: cupredoxin domain-containing protein [Actinomycetota bacterium]